MRLIDDNHSSEVSRCLYSKDHLPLHSIIFHCKDGKIWRDSILLLASSKFLRDMVTVQKIYQQGTYYGLECGVEVSLPNATKEQVSILYEFLAKGKLSASSHTAKQLKRIMKLLRVDVCFPTDIAVESVAVGVMSQSRQPVEFPLPVSSSSAVNYQINPESVEDRQSLSGYALDTDTDTIDMTNVVYDDTNDDDNTNHHNNDTNETVNTNYNDDTNDNDNNNDDDTNDNDDDTHDNDDTNDNIDSFANNEYVINENDFVFDTNQSTNTNDYNATIINIKCDPEMIIAPDNPAKETMKEAQLVFDRYLKQNTLFENYNLNDLESKITKDSRCAKKSLQLHCSQCGQSFKTLDKFAGHCREEFCFATRNNIDCPMEDCSFICGRSPGNKPICIKAMKKHVWKEHTTKKRPFQCTICQRVFSSQGAHDLHIKKHSDPKKSYCVECEKFYTLDSLSESKKHMSCTELAIVSAAAGSKQEEDSKKNSGTPCCSLCGKRFQSITHFKRHLLGRCKHFTKSRELACYKRNCSFTVNVPGKRPHKSQIDELTQHLQLKHQVAKKLIACSFCDDVFITVGKLKNHLLLCKSWTNLAQLKCFRYSCPYKLPVLISPDDAAKQIQIDELYNHIEVRHGLGKRRKKLVQSFWNEPSSW